MTFANKTQNPMNEFAIQFNVNTFGIQPSAPLSVPTLAPGQQATTSLPLNRGGKPQQMNPPNLIQVAIKNNVGVYYFATQIPAHIVS